MFYDAFTFALENREDKYVIYALTAYSEVFALPMLNESEILSFLMASMKRRITQKAINVHNVEYFNSALIP